MPAWATVTPAVEKIDTTMTRDRYLFLMGSSDLSLFKTIRANRPARTVMHVTPGMPGMCRMPGDPGNGATEEAVD